MIIVFHWLILLKDFVSVKGVAFALAYNSPIEFIFMGHCSIESEVQQYIVRELNVTAKHLKVLSIDILLCM